jgi:cell shape-determining protein MreC
VLADRVGASLPASTADTTDPEQRVKQLEDENQRLRKALSDLVLRKLVPEDRA